MLIARLTRFAGNTLMLAALAAFLWCGLFLFRAHLVQNRTIAMLKHGSGEVVRSTEQSQVPVRAGAPLGRIDIQRVGIASVILEGTDKETLALSVGHVPGTALSGLKGNVALAAHRDTFFRGLERIRVGDNISLKLTGRDFAYRVDVTRIVRPSDVSVLNENGTPTLTLITCYPFHYVGPAPSRFIVQAHLVIRPSL